MKKFNRTFVTANGLMVDDCIKVAGIMYRIHTLYRVDKEIIIQFYNVRRPILTGALTVNKNTLMKIWNQK